jgi:hypothetical protein
MGDEVIIRHHLVGGGWWKIGDAVDQTHGWVGRAESLVMYTPGHTSRPAPPGVTLRSLKPVTYCIYNKSDSIDFLALLSYF